MKARGVLMLIVCSAGSLVAAAALGYYAAFWSIWIAGELVRKRTEWVAERAVRVPARGRMLAAMTTLKTISTELAELVRRVAPAVVGIRGGRAAERGVRTRPEARVPSGAQ